MAINKLYYGDNLEVLRRYIKDDSIDLCYIDPPFNSNRNYNQIYNNIGKEDKAQSQAFIDTWTWDEVAEDGLAQIAENVNGVSSVHIVETIFALYKILGKGSLMAYLISMTLRIMEIRRVLKPTGSFYLHCDPTASHYLKIVCDAIFCGEERDGQFLNEIIWHYRRWTGKAANYQALHDVIFFYTKSTKHTFNVQYTPYTEKSLKRKQNYHTRIKGDDVFVTSIDEKRVRDNDVWQIQLLNSQSKERLGYPTQKPEELLEKVILGSSKEGDVVLDAYCGCGTTVSVAQRLKRKWIGIDITYHSISLILKRLEDGFGKKVVDAIELNGVPKDMKSAVALANKKEDKTRKEFEKWAVLTYSDNRAAINEKKGGDRGIDGIAFMLDRNEKSDSEYNKVIFSVKSNKTLSPSVIRDLNGTMEREGAAMGYLITLYPMPNLVKESKQYGVYHNTLLDKNFPKIEVISIEEILNGKRMSIPASHKISVVKEAEENYGSIQPALDL
jgi:DNA modification methylase